MKRSQAEIVLNPQPAFKKSPLSKPLKSQKSFEIKINKETTNSKPEYRTEVNAVKQ